jgi:LPS sulfotransferase NodH
VINKVPSYESFIVCTSPRSGSTLLCKLLAATGKSGKPDSHFHSPSVSDWTRNYSIAAEDFHTECELLSAIFMAARDRGTGSTSMFGLRMQGHSFDYFMQKLRVLHESYACDSERIHAAFGKTLFIHLSRKDKLDQAISYVKAAQSGLWHIAADGTELERLSVHQEPVYDEKAIAHQCAKLSDMDKRWESWFIGEGLDPLRVQYNDLSDNPIGVVCEVLHRLGIDPEIARGLELPIARLADATNKSWAKKYREGRHE